MTAADILGGLLRVNLAAGVAILTVIALRKTVRSRFGARLAYGLWLAPALAGAAAMGPARQVLIVQSAAPAIAGAVGVSSPLPSPSSGPGVSLDPAVLTLGLWFAGVCAAAVVMVHLQRRFMRQARNGAVGPAVVGVIVPRIVTPRDFRHRYSQDEQALVLAHEQAHVARQDSRLNGLCAAAQCVCWFNPLVHLAARLMRADQELACDETVVARFPGARRAYAEVLMKAQLAILPLPLGCYWPSKAEHPLVERIAMLRRRADVGGGRRSVGVALLSVLLASVGLAAWAAQPAQVRVRLTTLETRPAPEKPEPQELSDPAAAPAQAALERAMPAPPARTVAATGKASPTPTPESSPPIERVTASTVSLEAAAGVEVSKSSLISVSDRTPDDGQPLGPGHYVERSGLKSSGGCGEQAFGGDYRISTRPVAPGHILTNFHYELVGDGRCKPRRPFETVTASCEIVSDRPDRKTVQFRLLPDGDYCFSFSAFQRDGSQHDNEARGTITQGGAVTRGEMVLSYDVQ